MAGADGLIDRARSMRPSVNISAANLKNNVITTEGNGHFYATNLRTVWPSTPVCSKFIPAEPSAQTMI